MTTPAAGPLTTIRVYPVVWQQAITLAAGDARRIIIMDAHQVRVYRTRADAEVARRRPEETA